MSSFFNFLFGICLAVLFFLSGYSIYSLRSLEGKFDSLSESPSSNDREIWYSRNRGSLVANLYFLYEFFIFYLWNWFIFPIFYLFILNLFRDVLFGLFSLILKKIYELKIKKFFS